MLDCEEVQIYLDCVKQLAGACLGRWLWLHLSLFVLSQVTMAFNEAATITHVVEAKIYYEKWLPLGLRRSLILSLDRLNAQSKMQGIPTIFSMDASITLSDDSIISMSASIISTSASIISRSALRGGFNRWINQLVAVHMLSLLVNDYGATDIEYKIP
ncbi:hypothetical protein FRB95_009958 [Tulasnella sp. JGI-2019a]|nr:hypothetical protein FRB95_009958 [Tulasnella sp. JGI-2019a]